MKYAFGDDGGTITVSLQQAGDEIVLQITDDGFGAEQSDADNNGSTGLGSRLMTAFAKQLRGTLSQTSKPGEGFVVELRMPKETAEKKVGNF
jgi:two-component sensor histidine kinase